MGMARRLAVIAALGLAAAGLSTAGAAAATAGRPVVLYASPGGAGAACTVSAPCGLAAARSRVERLSGHMTADIDVDLLGGTYHVPGGLRLGPADSGRDGFTVVWQAAPGQRPVISGADRITGFSRYDRGLNIWRRRSPRARRRRAGSSCSSTGSGLSWRGARGRRPGCR